MENNNQLNTSYEERMKTKLDQVYSKEKNSFFGFFIKNYRITYLLIIALLLSGIWSLFTLPLESEPEVKVPYAIVTTIYPGANPTDVEELVTDKIENKIKDIDNLEEYNSSSSEGVSMIFVEFDMSVELREALDDLREAIDEAVPDLPSDVEKPTVRDINFNDISISTYSLIGDYSDVELKDFADILQEAFESINGVSEAKIRGGVEREFQVIVDQNKLSYFNISLGQVVAAIQSANFSLPAGNIEIDNIEYSVRVDGKFFEANELENVVISTYNSVPVYLRDLAVVQDGFKEKETESRIAFKDGEARNAISLQIHKKTGGNILDISQAADDLVASAHEEGLIPEDIEILKSNDNAKYIKDEVMTLGSSAVQTMLLIALVLWLVLSARGAVITALAVPIAFFMSFLFLKIQGLTLNSIVLFALVLSLGLMVDNAIVIIEGINEYMTKYKKKPLEAAILSVWNFKWAIIAGTLTTVCAFLPMMFVLSGVMGEYLGILPKTLTVTLLSSLFVALIIIPTLATKFLKFKEGEGSHRSAKRHKFIEKQLNKLQFHYEKFLRQVLPHKKKRKRLIVSVFLIFFLLVLTPIVGIMEVSLFPSIDSEYFNVEIELPVGSLLEDTNVKTQEIEEIINQIPELDSYVTTIGAAGSTGVGQLLGSSEKVNEASIVVNLVEENDRDRDSFEVAEDLRDQLALVQGATITVQEVEAGPGSTSPIELQVIGDDLIETGEVAQDVKDYLATVPGVINIDDSLSEAAGEFVFEIDKQKANYYGLSVSSIASTIRMALYGTTASTVNIDGEDVDITVKYDQNKFTNINDLENIALFTAQGETITLKQVADLDFGPSFTTLSHRDGKRLINVTADTEDGVNATKVMNEFIEVQNGWNLPEGVDISIGGEMEEINTYFTQLLVSLAVAVLLIAFILILQFNSFRQPLIILFALPLSLIGVFIGLNLFRQPFSLTAFIGVVSLAGIVVNDAIVLIDKINKNISNGMDFMEGIIDGGKSRMQPIFVTSITTIVGIFPLLFSDVMWRGLSLTVICGLIFSTMLTLVIVPVLYMGITRKKRFEEEGGFSR